MPHIESIGDLAEQVLQEVRSSKLTKLAEQSIVKEASAIYTARTPLGRQMLKIAAQLREADTDVDVSVDELRAFVNGES